MNSTTVSNARTQLPAYGRIPKDLLRDPNISANAKLVWAIVDEVAGHEWLTIEKIATWLGKSHPTAERAVYELRDAGWLGVTEKYVAGRQVANEYVAQCLPCEQQTMDRPITSDGQGAITHEPPGAITSEPQNETVDNETVVRDEKTPGQQVIDVPVSAPHSRASAESEDPSEGFDEFWKLYPRRVAKGQAVKAWKTATKTTAPTVILDAAAHYRDDPNLPEKRFIPYPATWLNGQCWEDGPCETRNGNGYRPNGEQTAKIHSLAEKLRAEGK
jgi:hypothetical protein